MSHEKEDAWSYTIDDQEGYWVRVFERAPGSRIWISWRAQKVRQRESLRALSGVPVTDRAWAREIAERVAERLETGNASDLSLRELMDYPPARTLTELYEALFKEWGPTWTKKERDVRSEVTSEFWRGQLGSRRHIHTVQPSEVRAVLKEARDRRGWSTEIQRVHMKCLLSAFRFAWFEKGWLRWEETLYEVASPGDPDWDPRHESEILLDSIEGGGFESTERG